LDCTAISIGRNLERLVASDASTAFVAEDSEGAVAGYCAVHWVPFLFLPGGEAYVTELFVKPSESGKGCGSKLLDAVVAEAGRRGCARVSLLNGRLSEAYRREFYRKKGWVEREHMANFVLWLTEDRGQPGD
jgi:GNAT superfamily N-acetyltransferase